MTYLEHSKTTDIQTLQTDREVIREIAKNNQEENDAFRSFLIQLNSSLVDEMTIRINEEVDSAIDCTSCGACCGQLMVNVSRERAEKVAHQLQLSINDFEEKYVEKSEGGMMIMNTIPCHFLCDNKCTIYEYRFDECRDFPGLHRPGIQTRLFAMMIHYGMCPIIFNVLERMKIETGFKKEHPLSVAGFTK